MQIHSRPKLVATPEGIFLNDVPLYKCDLGKLSERTLNHLLCVVKIHGGLTDEDWKQSTPLRTILPRVYMDIHVAMANAGSISGFPLHKEFNPDQPRDYHGRWTSDPATDATPPSASSRDGFVSVNFPDGTVHGNDSKAGNYPNLLAPRTDGGKVDIDWKFISKQEGGQQLKGYVPDPEGSNSGVTIATGFDVGQHSEHEIDNLKNPLAPEALNALKEKLKPYCGLKREAAKEYLEEHPLTITKGEADALDGAVRQHEADVLASNYNEAVDAENEKDQGNRVHFEQLPRSVQTAIASYKFQIGSFSGKQHSDFWQDITQQRWRDASDYLKREIVYTKRRKLEAKLIDEAIDEAPKRSDELSI